MHDALVGELTVDELRRATAGLLREAWTMPALVDRVRPRLAELLG